MPLKVIKDSKESGMTFKSGYIGEVCSECGEARMNHPQVYVFSCPYCNYSYMMQPCSSPFSRGIMVLHKSEVRKSFKKQK